MSPELEKLDIKTFLKKSRPLVRHRLPGVSRLKRLYRSLSQKDTKVVLSLGGGGTRMFAHISVLKFLEHLKAEKYISEIWGSSGGAIVGLLYSMGTSPEQIIKESIRLFSAQYHVKIMPSLFSIMKNIAKETVFGNDSETSIKGFHSIYEGLQELVNRTVRGGSERFPFYCLAYNMGTNQTDVLTPQEIHKDVYPQFIYQEDPLEAIVASSAIPILFMPHVFKDEEGERVYVDGSTGEEIPTVSVYKKWLRDKELGLESRKRLLVIAVDLHPDFSSLGFLNNWLFQRIPVFKYVQMTINLTDLMRKARLEEQKRILTNDPNVELWSIDFNMKGGGLLNANSIPRVITEAEKSFPKQFVRINDSLLG